MLDSVTSHKHSSESVIKNSDELQATEFLHTLFKHKPTKQAVYIWTNVDKRSEYFFDVTKAIEYALVQKRRSDVYFGVCTVSSDFALNKVNEYKRGSNDSVVGVPALCADIDYGTNHSKKNLPPTQQDAIALVMKMPITATLIVDSGNGLHVYWILDNFFVIDDDEQRARITILNNLLKQKLRELAAEYNWTIDAIQDLARVLRVPNTLNHKDANDIKPVELLTISHKKYSIEELRNAFDGKILPSPNRSPSNGESNSEAATFTLKENPVINKIWLDEFFKEYPLAKQSFYRKNKNVKDQSPSGFDLSLVSYLIQAGCSDQQTVDVAVYVRIKNGEDLKLRVDYWARTLTRAKIGQPSSPAFNDTKDETTNDTQNDEPSEVSATIETKSKTATSRQFPQIDDKAFYGTAGELVRLIEPHSEADPIALLAQLLVGFGSLIGRNAHLLVEADKHFTNINVVLVGESSKARKGTSWGQIRTRLTTIEPNWEERVMSGLSSGEGLIWQVRDPIEKRVRKVDKKTGEVSYEDEIVDVGVDDKRLLIFEGEFASVLNVAQRDGNILSALIRNAWDTGNLSTLVKNSPNKATDAHVSIIGHITRDELLRKLDATEQANGFANRFMWLSVKRSKLLPLGGKLQTVDFASVIVRLTRAANNAYNAGEMKLNDKAIKLWCDVYPKLSEGRAGMLGAITSRGEAQTLRLALIYALLDESTAISSEHLEAALAFWKYAEDSAQFIFGDALGDPIADELMRSLRSAGEMGMTRTEIRDLFNRHNTPGVQRALGSLIERGVVRVEKEETAGRPIERFFAA